MSEFINYLVRHPVQAAGLTVAGLGLCGGGIYTGSQLRNQFSAWQAENQRTNSREEFIQNCLSNVNPESVCSVDGDEMNFFNKVSQIGDLVSRDSVVSKRSKANLNNVVRRLAELMNQERFEVRFGVEEGAVSGYTRFNYDVLIPYVAGLGERPLIVLPKQDPTDTNAGAWGTAFHELQHLLESKGEQRVHHIRDSEEERRAEFYGELVEAVLKRNGYSYSQKEAIDSFGVDLPEVIYYLDSQQIGPDSNVFHFFSQLRFRYLYNRQNQVLQERITLISDAIVEFADNQARVDDLMQKRNQAEEQIKINEQGMDELDIELKLVSSRFTHTDKRLIHRIKAMDITSQDFFAFFSFDENHFISPRHNNREVALSVWKRRSKAPRPTLGYSLERL